MSKISALLLFLFFLNKCVAQCTDDNLHSSGLSDSWISCSPRINPFLNRGVGHWILYEFDEAKDVNRINIWNIVHPDYLNYGVKNIRMEVSTDGKNWSSSQDLAVSIGSADATYLGESIDVPDFRAKYVLFTLLENYGGKCWGFSEVKFNLGNTTDTEEHEISKEIVISPNPFSEFTTIRIDGSEGDRIYYEIIDIQGRILTRQNISLNTNKEFQIIGNGLITGTYFIKIYNQDLLQTQKLVVVHPN